MVCGNGDDVEAIQKRALFFTPPRGQLFHPQTMAVKKERRLLFEFGLWDGTPRVFLWCHPINIKGKSTGVDASEGGNILEDGIDLD